MAHVINFIIPLMGEPIESARLVSWHVKPGDSFQKDDILLEIETDKSIMEIPSGEAGVMVEHLLQVDGILDSGTPVARIQVDREPGEEEEESGAGSENSPDSSSKELAIAEPASERVPDATAGAGDATVASRKAGGSSTYQASRGADDPASGSRLKSSPSARRLAREADLDLGRIAGSGPEGRIVQADVLRATPSGGRATASATRHQQPRSRGKTQMQVATRHGGINVTRWVPDAPRCAPLIVLVHGMFGDMDTWSGLTSALNRAGLSVLAVDLPCHGESRSIATHFPDIVQALAEVVSAQSDGPVILVGHSFGAAVATRLASQPGLDADSLVLIAPVGLGTEIQQGFLDGVSRTATPESLARELRKLTVMDVVLSADYLETLHKRLKKNSRQLQSICEQFSQQGVQQIDIVPDLRDLAIPATIIQGRLDQIIPWEHVLNAPPKSALHIIPHAGHMPQWDSSALVCDIVIRASA